MVRFKMLHWSDSWKPHSKENYRAMWGDGELLLLLLIAFMGSCGDGEWGSKAGGVNRGWHWKSMATIPSLSVQLSHMDLRMHDFSKCLSPWKPNNMKMIFQLTTTNTWLVTCSFKAATSVFLAQTSNSSWASRWLASASPFPMMMDGSCRILDWKRQHKFPIKQEECVKFLTFYAKSTSMIIWWQQGGKKRKKKKKIQCYKREREDRERERERERERSRQTDGQKERK